MTTPAPNMGSAPSWAGPPGIQFATVATLGPPGTAQQQRPLDLSSAVQRPGVPCQTGGPFPSGPAMGGPTHQGLWLQQPPPQMGGVPMLQRPPYHHGAATAVPFPGPFSLMARDVQAPDSHPPGVGPVGSIGSSRVESQPSGDRSQVQESGNQVAAVVNEQPDAWTAHRTETGVVYYYNALTGESTYDKPPEYIGEPEKVAVQPVPVSMVNLPGTDWVLVSTSDGKKYYYNNMTKVSSWQIPNEVTELRKMQESDKSKEQPMSVPDTNVVTEKGSTSVSLNAPAINIGGREAMALRPSNAQGSSSSSSSSALDLIKKKLQESGTPATSSPGPLQSGATASESNGSRAVEASTKGQQSENSKDKAKDANGDGNATDSSSDSEDSNGGPTKEECIIQFKEMLKERGVAPFSKWEKELPKIVFDPRFKAIPSYSTRRSLFEHYVKTRVEEERKEKRAAQKAVIEGFKQLLDEATEDINPKTDYQTFRQKWGEDLRFLALDLKDRENLLNERVLPLKKAAEEKAQAIRAAVATSFKSMLREKGDITVNSRWSRVKDSFRDDPRYKSVRHEDREALFNDYLSDLKAAEDEAEKEAKAKRDEQDKLKERERELRKRKEREEQEMERVRNKVRRKEAVTSFQALLVETIKDPQASWTESKPKLEKDPQGRASNSDLESSEMEKLFREHIKSLHDRCAREFKALLAEVLTAESASRETDDGKTVLNSWTTAKRLLKPDHRYNKMPRKDRETLWRRYAEDMLRKQKSEADPKEDKMDPRNRSAVDSVRLASGSRGTHERR